MWRQEHLFEVIQIVSGPDLIMFSLMILNIVNDTEIFRIVSFPLHSVWLSGSIKHCQPRSRPSWDHLSCLVWRCEVMSAWQMSSVTLIINHLWHCYYLLALLLSRRVTIIKSYIILQPLSALTCAPLLLSSPAPGICRSVCHILRIFPIFQHKAGLT